ncbi:MAG: phosphoglycerate kinase [Armatimonadota bacterium]|jgi:phosphoglycerate kinase
MARKSTISDVELSGQRTLVRVDFNVPLQDGEITDETRIEAALPTINVLLDAGCPVTLCSHLGRPADAPDPEFSLRPVADRLNEIFDAPVAMAPDCIGDEVAQMRADLGAGEVLLLENTRFHVGEKKNDPEFARALAGDAELYVDDAFGSMHRAHASTVGVTEFIDTCVAGLLVGRELEALTKCREASGNGFVVILGGAKAEDKLKAITELLPRVEKLLIGGAMAWAFFKLMGREVGSSLCKPDSVEAARAIMEQTEDALLERLVFPLDVHMKQVEPDTGEMKFADADAIEKGWDALDIGPRTQEQFGRIIREEAEIVFWNGPMGYFEKEPFNEGTLAIARALADTNAYTVVGGGDSAAAVTQMGFDDDMSHVSTGGGASIEYVQGDVLPGVEALDEA